MEVGANLGGADIDCGGKVGKGNEEFAFYARAGTERHKGERLMAVSSISKPYYCNRADQCRKMVAAVFHTEFEAASGKERLYSQFFRPMLTATLRRALVVVGLKHLRIQTFLSRR